MKFRCFIIISIFLAGCSKKIPLKTGHENELLPQFSLFLSDSSTILNTRNIPNNQYSVLFNFGPQCGYSMEQMQDIINNVDKFPNTHFYIFTNASFAEMKGFYERFQLKNYPNISVGIDRQNFFGEYFHVMGFPYISIYGKDRKLIQAFIGKIDSKQIRQITNE